MSLPTLFTYGNCDYNLIIKWEQGVSGILNFFLGVQETFINVDQILHHKIKLNKCEKSEFIRSTFSENSLIKLEINNRKISGKSSNKNILLYNP